MEGGRGQCDKMSQATLSCGEVVWQKYHTTKSIGLEQNGAVDRPRPLPGPRPGDGEWTEGEKVQAAVGFVGH
jgi:hypothetical protein